MESDKAVEDEGHDNNQSDDDGSITKGGQNVISSILTIFTKRSV